MGQPHRSAGWKFDEDNGAWCGDRTNHFGDKKETNKSPIMWLRCLPCQTLSSTGGITHSDVISNAEPDQQTDLALMVQPWSRQRQQLKNPSAWKWNVKHNFWGFFYGELFKQITMQLFQRLDTKQLNLLFFKLINKALQMGDEITSKNRKLPWFQCLRLTMILWTENSTPVNNTTPWPH